ncbi:MAG: zf-HC2 domain-containing protein [Gemmatimonadaceae bacterium]
MNKCVDREIQEMLPDLLHDALETSARLRVEAHLATCEGCTDDLDVLRAVKAAVVFAPAIDTERVVLQIPPYRTIVPATEQPARTRRVSWLVAATLALVAAGGGSMLVMEQQRASTSSAIATGATRAPRVVAPIDRANGETPEMPVIATTEPSTHALALAADVAALSDVSLTQLMNEMDDFDALPGAEPEAVISVDNGAGD